MMKILHLYHNAMNLYGEYANVIAVRDMILRCGESCEIEKKSYGEDVNFSNYDFVYIGSGTERTQKFVMADFLRHRQLLETYVENGKAALLTGNAFEMLGVSVTDCKGRMFEGMGLFDFTTVEQNKTRNTSDAVFEADFLNHPVVGFINKCSEISGIDTSLFSVKMGLGNCKDSTGEGVRCNNLFCTHLTGPVLMKNPELLSYMTKIITGKDADPHPLAVKGYEVTLQELTARMEA